MDVTKSIELVEFFHCVTLSISFRTTLLIEWRHNSHATVINGKVNNST